MPVDRCICHNITFKEIKKVAEEQGLTSLEEIQIEKIASAKCKMCEPYVKEVLKSGKTSFKPGFYLK